jgi:glycogen synthase
MISRLDLPSAVRLATYLWVRASRLMRLRDLSIAGTVSPAKEIKRYQERYLPVIRSFQHQL